MAGAILPHSFYARAALVVARDLLGMELPHRGPRPDDLTEIALSDPGKGL